MTDPNDRRLYFDLANGELRVIYDPETGLTRWSPEHEPPQYVVGVLGKRYGATMAEADRLKMAMDGVVKTVEERERLEKEGQP